MQIKSKQSIVRGCVSLLLFVLSACQSAVSTLPAIVVSIPANGATDVALNTKLSLQFSKAMNQNSVKVVVNPPLNLGEPVWNGTSTLVFDPPDGWQPQTNYTLNVEGSDLSGNNLTGNRQIAFQTAAAFDTTPPATPTNVIATIGDSELTLRWDANSETDLSGYNVYFGARADALESGFFVAQPATEARFTELENTQIYFFALDAEDISGNRSERSSIGSATPRDLLAPSLVSSEPANLSQDLSLVPTLRLRFSEAMDTSSVAMGVCVSDMPVAEATCDTPEAVNFGTPSWSEGDTLVQFIPTDQFHSGKTHVLVISASDKAGNLLSGPSTVTFSTRATPDVTPPSVLDRIVTLDRSLGTATISLLFDKAMDQTSVQDAFLSQPALGCAWTWEINEATCRVTSGLQQLTDYTITLGTGATDSGGNSLVSPFQFTFSTGNFAPRVLSFRPSSRFGFPINVSEDAPIVLVFSEPMNQSSAQTAFEVQVDAAVWAGNFEWNAEGTEMTYRPTTAYGPGKTVTWIISTAAKELGEGFRSPVLSLPSAVSSSFSTRPVIGATDSYNSGGQP